jgi:hypothetical protein
VRDKKENPGAETPGQNTKTIDARNDSTSSDYVTVLEVQNPKGPANKRVSIKDGKPVKRPGAPIVFALAKTIGVPGADGLADVLRTIGDNTRQLFICGYVQARKTASSSTSRHLGGSISTGFATMTCRAGTTSTGNAVSPG